MKLEEKLSRMIQVDTVSQNDVDNSAKFRKFHAVLEEIFPSVFKTCSIVKFNEAILLKWKGKSDDGPIVLMSHQDVVEAAGEWKVPPFSGLISDGSVWGRGAVDTKSSLMCIFEALEELINEGFTPERDIYISSSDGEEISGEGAKLAVDYLESKGVRPLLVLDEGGMIKEEPIKGAEGKFAMMGTLEKGTCNFRFTAKGKGGHASAPGKNTPLVRLGQFMADIEKKDPFRAKMNETTIEMFRRMGPAIKGPLGFLLTHARFFSPLLEMVLPKVNRLATAMIKTTIAFTTAKGSDGLNVLPSSAYVTGNCRVIHHTDADETLRILTDIAARYDIDVEVINSNRAYPVVDHNSSVFRKVETAVKTSFPSVITCPYAMTGGTDAHHFSRICDNVIRFAPLEIDNQQYESIHAANENINISTLRPGVDFYKKIIVEF